MSVIVKVTCDRDIGEGTCPESTYGRPGEDIARTLERAGRAGWTVAVVPSGDRAIHARTICPRHGIGRGGGTGPL